jgi:Kdo2-lipid IVA lauroyltransferase/acyltransferase
MLNLMASGGNASSLKSWVNDLLKMRIHESNTISHTVMSFKIKHVVEYAFFRCLGFIVRLLPLRLVHKTGFTLARAAYPLLKSRRKVALRNLRNAFPEMDEQRREQIAYHSFQHISATFIELLWSLNMTKELIKQRVCIDNFDLWERLQERNKGIVFLTAHFGSWELAIQAISVYTDSTVCTIAKSQSNIFVDRTINRWRELFGLKIVPMGVSVREILRTLQQRGIVALAADQTAPKESVPVEFFGRPVPTFQGPAVFSLKTGAPIVLGCTVRQENGNYKMHLVHVPSDDLIDFSDKHVFELTQRQVRMTEEIIRQYPEQWMWMHKRWKHVPDRVEAS